MNVALTFGSNGSSFGRSLLVLVPVGLMALSSVASAQTDTRSCLAASHASVEALDRHDVMQEYRQLSTCSDEACPSLVREECQRRRDSLTKQMSRFRFTFANLRSSDAREVYVSVDGQPEEAYSEYTSIALPAGHHELVFRFQSTSLTQSLDATGKGDVIERQLTWPLTAAAESGPLVLAPTDEHETHPWDATKTTAVVLGGVGVVSLAVAGGYALSALAKRDRAAGACPGVCTSAGDVERWEAAERAGDTASIWATVGWLGFTAGGVLLAVGFYTDATPEPAVKVGFGPGTVLLDGQF
jgi:hypothetical protein